MKSNYWYHQFKKITKFEMPAWKRQADGNTFSPITLFLKFPLFWFIFGLVVSCIAFSLVLLNQLGPPGKGNVFIIGAGYEENLHVTPNIFGLKAMKAFSSWLKSQNNPGLVHIEKIITPTKNTEFFLPQINSKSKNLIIFVSLVAGADDKGPYFLKNDGLIFDNEKAKLRLETILSELKKYPEDLNKLIIIDPISNQKLIGFGGMESMFKDALKFQDSLIGNIPNLSLIVGNTDEDNPIEDELPGYPYFWKKIGEFISGNLKQPINKTNTIFSNLNLDNQSLSLVKYYSSHFTLYPSGKLGEDRLINVSRNLPKDIKAPVFEENMVTSNISEIIKETWENYFNLTNQKTKPWVYAPDIWRQYGKLCNRIESLRLSGFIPEITTLQTMKRKFEVELEERKNLSLKSESIGFQYMWIEGNPEYEDKIAFRIIEKLDKQKIPEIKNQIEEMAKNGTSEKKIRKILNLVSEKILERAIEIPSINLEEELDKILYVNNGTTLLPNEIQTGLTYSPKNFFINKKADNTTHDYFEILLKLKLDSEKVSFGIQKNISNHSYPEKIWPFISDYVMEGDKKRNLAQDYFAATDSDSFDNFRVYSTEAKEAYTKTIKIHRTLQKAFEIRDRLANDLPWITHWLLLENPITLPEVNGNKYPWDEKIRNLWTNFHNLSKELLELPLGYLDSNNRFLINPNGFIKEENVDSLQRKTSVLITEFENLNDNLLVISNSALEQDSIKSWIFFNHLLQTPIPSMELREKIWKHQNRVENDLLIKLNEEGDEEILFKTADEIDKVKLRARNGDIWISWIGFPGLGLTPQSLGIVEGLANSISIIKNLSNQEEIFKKSCLLKDSIHFFFVENFKIANSFRESLETKSKPPLPYNLPNLKNLDRFSRIDPWSLTYPAKFEKSFSGLLRHAEIRDFLCWQGIRIWNDNLYFNDNKTQPYFLLALNNIFLDLLKLNGPTNNTDLIDSLKNNPEIVAQRIISEAEKTTGLMGETPWTLEDDRKIRFFITQKNNSRPIEGKVSLDIEDNPLFNHKFEKTADKNKRLISIGNNINQKFQYYDPIIFKKSTLDLTQKSTSKTNIELKGFFRGKSINLPVAIELHNKPNIQQIHMDKNGNGSISVKTNLELSGLNHNVGGITFVIDASGSMGARPGDANQINSKYYQAIQALEKLCKTIPQGIQISIWVFGQAVGSGKTTENPESNIFQVIPPVLWDPNNKKLLQDVIAKLSYPNVEPWNTSPLIRTISLAANDLKNIKGKKFLIALTDGLDNRIEKDKFLNPNALPASLVIKQLLDNKNIQLQILSFPCTEKEQQEMLNQFGSITSLEPPGSFVQIEKVDEIVSKISRFMAPKYKLDILNYDNTPISTELDSKLEFSKRDNDDHWFSKGLKKGFYHLNFSGGFDAYSEIKIEPNDRLLLELYEDSFRNYKFKRISWGKEYFPQKPFLEKTGWRSSLLANQTNGKNTKLFFCLEKLDEGNETVLANVEPKEIWMELKSINSASITPNNEYYSFSKVPYYPGNSYMVNYSHEEIENPRIKPEKVLSLWWNSDQETPFSSRLLKDIDYESWMDIEGKKTEVDGKPVYFEKCKNQKIGISDSNGILTEQNALVLYMSHSLNQFLTIKIEGMKNMNVHSNWYQNTGRTCFVIWPVPPVPETPSAIQLSSVNRMKHLSESRGMHIKFNNFNIEKSTDLLPAPIRLDK